MYVNWLIQSCNSILFCIVLVIVTGHDHVMDDSTDQILEDSEFVPEGEAGVTGSPSRRHPLKRWFSSARQLIRSFRYYLARYVSKATTSSASNTET